ncbi:hypothetical protein DJ564_26795 [Pseudomonas sp. 31-12]|nr:hypothetical protein DJ564_26795 [Pseudomonas sp. 31-12]
MLFLCPKFMPHHKSPVGASLLAIAVCQPPLMLNVAQSSRAGSLPQESSVFSGTNPRHKKSTPKGAFLWAFA